MPVDCGRSPSLKKLVATGVGKEIHKWSNQIGPTGLVAGPQPGPVIAVEVFIEKHMIAPVGVVLKLAFFENSAQLFLV